MVIPLYGRAWLTHRVCGMYVCVCSAPVSFHFCVVLAQGVKPWQSPPCSVTWMYRMPTRNKNIQDEDVAVVCMYGHTYSKSIDQPGKVANLPQKGCCTDCADVGTPREQAPTRVGVFCFSVRAKRERKEAASENLWNRFLNARRTLTPRL